jgi:cathepsin L
MKLIILLSVVAVALAVRSGNFEEVEGYTFEEYIQDFNKQYTSEEDRALHQAVFEVKLREVVEHNADDSQTWKKGVNQFTDMTEKEFSAFKGLNRAQLSARRNAMPSANIRYSNSLPDSVDWRTKNAISPVKNQGGCGSCWAFAATESIESSVFLNTGKMPILSPQNIVSCTPNPQHCGGTGGCDGATPELAFNYTKSKNIASEQDYPYQARTGTCKEGKKTATVDGYVKLGENDYNDLVQAVANVGPIAVSVDANSWGSYSSGVFTGCPKAPRNVIIDHAVQLVGYGTDATRKLDYWIVRNSWGGSWGEKGYIRMEKHSDGDKSKWCAIDNRPQDGSGCDGGPPQVTVCGSCGIWYDNSYATGGKLL